MDNNPFSPNANSNSNPGSASGAIFGTNSNPSPAPNGFSTNLNQPTGQNAFSNPNEYEGMNPTDQFSPVTNQNQFPPATNQFPPTSTSLAPNPSGNFQPTAPIQTTPKPHTNWATFQIVLVVILGALVALATGLFIWMFIMWNEANTDVQGKISLAEAEAIKNKTAELEADFTEREKYPYKTFVGPIDYGELTFEYPKTWSLYIASDASGNSDGYLAYLNPDAVTGTDSINALEVSIMNQSIDQVSQSYESSLTSGEVTVSVRPINGQNATIYTGDLSNDIRGIAALFKIRDKTAIIQTDAMIFSDSFYRILDTIKFNS